MKEHLNDVKAYLNVIKERGEGLQIKRIPLKIIKSDNT